uniref:CUB domain-containing protein n=1 Tax=Romanomermis culicivorax TaxID=13658 RepID=A0A915J757_ROMCU
MTRTCPLCKNWKNVLIVQRQCRAEPRDLTMALPQVKKFIYDSASRPMNGSFSTPAFVAYEKAVYRFHFRAKLDEVNKESVIFCRCLHNYVEIVVIDYYNEDHVSGRYCGNVAPPNLTTMQKGVDLVFSTSGARFYQGFKGTYRFIPERAVPPPRSFYPGKLNANAAGCGGIAQGYHGGVIKSPGYPNDYPANVDCNWVIRVRQNMKIFIKVLELELTPSITQCDDAQLVVLDGYAHVSNETLPAATNHQRIILCGESKYHNDEGLKSVMSIRNRMNIRFKTSKPPPTETRIRRRDFGSPIGFYLVWTEVSTEDTCDKFYCRGGAYCIDEGKKVCADRKRYCIDSSLVCDGIPNCAESDDSDEDNCKNCVIIGEITNTYRNLRYTRIDQQE